MDTDAPQDPKKSLPAPRLGVGAFWIFAGCLFSVGAFGLYAELSYRAELSPEAELMMPQMDGEGMQDIGSLDTEPVFAQQDDAATDSSSDEEPLISAPAPLAVDGEAALIPLRDNEFIRNATFCRDGSLIATVCNDTDIILWDAATHQKLEGQRMAHEEAINLASFSPTGKVLATASRDSTVRLWDTRTHKQLPTTLSHSHSVDTVVFSPTSERLLATGTTDGCVYLWDVQKGSAHGKPLQLGDPVSALAFSPNGKLIAATSYATSAARIWDVDKQKLTGELKVENELIMGSIAFNPNGKTIAAPVTDNSVRLWNASTRQQVGKPLPHPEKVSAVAFSPDGRILATLAERIRFWDTRSFAPIGEPVEYSGTFPSICFSPDGKTLACDNQQGCIIFHPVPAAED